MTRLFAGPARALAMALILVGVPGSGVAQNDGPAATTNVPPARIANGTRFGQWVVSCEALAVNETACVLTQRLARASDGAFLAEMLAFASADGTRRYIGARVPSGVYFPHGFAVRPAEGEAEETRFVWQSCSRDLCEALIELTEEELEALEGAEGGLIAGYRPGLLAQPLIFTMSVEGAGAGLDALAASAGAGAAE